ncbi:HAD-IA family hydrolase [Frankia gtarii]|uniref:HAD-IA family hydrolase n=1 Tax=Frankia gtarii TaxID=2950102 RepID=UPI0021C121B9|nr:HAD-IA family hydrolase [Frankia gtarii]
MAGGTYRQTVIFDLDGVLVDSFGVMRQAFTIAYAEVVGPSEPPFEEYNRHLGRYFPDIMRIMNLPLAMEEPFVRESYRLAREVVLFDGVEEMLRRLRARGHGLAVATGKSGPRARHLLGELGVLSLFDHVIGSDEIPRPKPAPDIVLRALDLLGTAPAEAMMLGDAVADIESARAAGVMAVAALWGETDGVELLKARPDAVLHRPAELLALLGAAGPQAAPAASDCAAAPVDLPITRGDLQAGSPTLATAAHRAGSSARARLTRRQDA